MPQAPRRVFAPDPRVFRVMATVPSLPRWLADWSESIQTRAQSGFSAVASKRGL